jgi:DNA-binding transcriptional MerR regulator
VTTADRPKDAERLGPARYNVDALAQVAGTLTSTVRMYQARGLLAPPVREGRQAFYGPEHLDRLKLISDLQVRGYSLAALNDLFAAWESGAALPDVLGLRATREPLVLSALDLADRLGGELTIDVAHRAVEAGAVRFRNDGMVEVPDPIFLTIGSALVAEGIPPGRIIDEWVALRAATDTIAARFAAVFADHLWPILAERPTALVDGTDAYDRLAPIAQQIVSVALAESFTHVVAEFVEQHR